MVIEQIHAHQYGIPNRERYQHQGLLENAVYPGIPEALVQLIQRGARLLLATSKPQPYAERIIDHFQLDSDLDSVWGSP